MTTAPCPLVFSQPDHVYRLNNIVIPSVTQVLRASNYVSFYQDLTEKIAAGLLSPSDGVYALIQRGQRLEAARQRGQAVHNLMHFVLEDDLDEDSIDEQYRGYLASGKQYLDAYVTDMFRAEFRVWSARHGCAGTMDLLGIHADGGVCVFDWKTGQVDDVRADLQLGAYLGFALEMATTDSDLASELRRTGPVVKRRAVRLFKDGRIAREYLFTDPRDFTHFLNALSLVHDQARRPNPITGWEDER